MKNIDIVEIDECTTKLKMLSNNLMLVRLGLTNKDVIPNAEVVDDALYVIEEEIERLAEKIAGLLCEEEAVRANNVDYKAEIAKLLESVEDAWLLNLIYRTIVNLLKPDDV